MSFIQKALKILQEFPNLKNEPFQVKDKKKKSFLQEAENFFRNLTSVQKPNQDDDSLEVGHTPLADNQDLSQTQNEIHSDDDPIVSTPIVPSEFNEDDEIIVDLDSIEELEANEITTDREEPQTNFDSSIIEDENFTKNLLESEKLLKEENLDTSFPFDETNSEQIDDEGILLDLDKEDEESIIPADSEKLEEGIEVSSLDDFDSIKPEPIDEFLGDTETLDIHEPTELTSDEPEDEANENSPDDASILEDWEKDAMAESITDSLLPEPDADTAIEDQDENQPEDESTKLEEPLVDVNVEEAFESAKEFKSSYEEKLESYLVLFEITKELLKSKSFDDFFENLMYSIIGQVGPEIMIIFSSRDGNFSQMKIVAHEGIDIEPDYVIKKGDTLYSLLESEHDVVYARDLLTNNLKERERVLLENPLTEILIPIRVMDQFSGFIVAGRMISGEEYTEKDFEFLQILVEVSGNFLSKLFDYESLSHEISELNKIIHSTDSITDFTNKVYTCKTLDELYDAISEHFLNDFKVSSFTFMILDPKNMDYKVFGSNFLLPETLGKLRLSKDSKITTMISQVSDVYRLENYQSNGELNSYISEQELAAMNEFTVIPLINIGRMVGLFIIHKVSTEWSPGFKRTILSLSNIVAPIIANLVMQNEKESLFRNPFNPLQETIDKEIKYCESKGKQFTLIVLKILNVTRILNILGINFFSEYSDFISKKIFENTKSSDYVSRIGQGKFAILLKENSKADSENFISKIKSEIVLFHNPSRDFKLSIQIYSLTYPDQAKDKRKFIEMMEET